MSAWKVALAMANAGGIKVTEVRMGSLRMLRNGLQSIWAQCPLEGALKAARVGRIQIG